VKRLNSRRVKIHRSYTVEEVARLFGVHKNTVRNWLTEGLQKIDDRRPILILGRELARFLHARRERRRQHCRVGELYCFGCRAPRTCAPSTADYLPLSPSSGNLRAACADCGTRMYRRVSLQKLAAVAGDLEIALPQAQQRIVEGADPSLNCHLEREPDAQPGE
jgi:excisionase family DNA binding protein